MERSPRAEPETDYNCKSAYGNGAQMNTVKLVHEGEQVDAEEVEFSTEGASEVVCRLDDGTVIRIAHDVKSIYRLREKKRKDGSPIYIVMGTASLNTKLKDGVPEMTEAEA
jgi:hypothetical protein